MAGAHQDAEVDEGVASDLVSSLNRMASGKFFTTPHYDGYANVLVRLEAVHREELAELLAESARIRAG